MKILIYKPGPVVQTIRLDKLSCTEPLELEYLYSALKNHDIKLIDGFIDKTDLLNIAHIFRPQAVLISACITHVEAVKELSAKLKLMDNKIIIIVGGSNAQVNPEHFYCDNVDLVYHSNSLEGIQQIINCISRNAAFNHIPGISFNTRGKFTKNQPLLLNPATFIVPDRILFNQHPDKYYFLYFDRCASVVSSWGCVGKCNFCFCRKMNNGMFTERSIEAVVNEIKEINTQNIYIVDDNFLVNRQRLQEFCILLKNNNIHKSFIIYGTAHFIANNRDTMRMLKDAGVSAVVVGLEFINDSDLQIVSKGSLQNHNDATIKICNELGIDLVALFIIDPKWKIIDFVKLAKYIKRNNILFATYATLTHFPGTELGKEKNGTSSNEKYWRYDFVRLHGKPEHISETSYYLWLFYLYFIPGLQFKTILLILKRYGFGGTINLFFNLFVIGLDFFIKLLIWR